MAPLPLRRSASGSNYTARSWEIQFCRCMLLYVVYLVVFAHWIGRVVLLSTQTEQLLDLPAFDDVAAPEVAVQGDALIPKRLVFTYETNILDTKQPSHYYKNVMQTIEGYKAYWNNSDDVVVSFLDDADCRNIIARSASFLLEHFDREPKGSYRGDICRLVTLYEQGGYYFDVDMELIEPYVAAPDVGFATAVEGFILQPIPYFFQSFLAASPKHPIIERTLYVVQDYYEHRRYSLIPVALAFMGPYTLKKAFDSFYREAGNLQRHKFALLKEVYLTSGVYDHLTRRDGSGMGCNYLVHDAQRKRPYFYSRMVGSSHCAFPS